VIFDRNLREQRPMSQLADSTHPNENPERRQKKLRDIWFAIAVIGLFVFACFYVLKVAEDLFLPIVLASFLGFLLTPATDG
jgi:hypothetical protein